jgi:hypothetical protein
MGECWAKDWTGTANFKCQFYRLGSSPTKPQRWPVPAVGAAFHLYELNLNEATQVLPLKLPVFLRYQKMQSSFGLIAKLL